MQFLNDLAFIMNDLLSTCSIGRNFKLFIDRVTLVFAQKTKKNGNKVTLRNVTNKNIENMTSFFFELRARHIGPKLFIFKHSIYWEFEILTWEGELSIFNNLRAIFMNSYSKYGICWWVLTWCWFDGAVSRSESSTIALSESESLN